MKIQDIHHSNRLTYITQIEVCMLSLTVTVIENKISNQGSNPSSGYLYFTLQ